MGTRNTTRLNENATVYDMLNNGHYRSRSVGGDHGDSKYGDVHAIDNHTGLGAHLYSAHETQHFHLEADIMCTDVDHRTIPDLNVTEHHVPILCGASATYGHADSMSSMAALNFPTGPSYYDNIMLAMSHPLSSGFEDPYCTFEQRHTATSSDLDDSHVKSEDEPRFVSQDALVSHHHQPHVDTLSCLPYIAMQDIQGIPYDEKDAEGHSDDEYDDLNHSTNLQEGCESLSCTDSSSPLRVCEELGPLSQLPDTSLVDQKLNTAPTFVGPIIRRRRTQTARRRTSSTSSFGPALTSFRSQSARHSFKHSRSPTSTPSLPSADCANPGCLRGCIDLTVTDKFEHDRAFPCIMLPYGCHSTFSSKNEWKRHVNTQHMRLHFWRCDLCSTPGAKPNDFSRKDLLMQHVRRMHAPAEIAGLSSQHAASPAPRRHNSMSSTTRTSHRLQPARSASTRHSRRSSTAVATTSSPNTGTSSSSPPSQADLATRCLHTLRQAPQHTRCLVCPAIFTGHLAWLERQEHVGGHMENYKKEGVPFPAVDLWSRDDQLLRWLCRESILVRRSAWELPTTVAADQSGNDEGLWLADELR